MEKKAEIAFLRRQIHLLTDEVRILGELAKIEEELVKLDSSRKPWPYTDTLKNAQEELIGMKTRLEELGESSETP
jgi:hypothetical protein